VSLLTVLFLRLGQNSSQSLKKSILSKVASHAADVVIQLIENSNFCHKYFQHYSSMDSIMVGVRVIKLFSHIIYTMEQ